ncbi:Nitric oxide synthase, inducible [Frankliniella fusca]|uniref:Nitric oxide synthase, inducible n=1 Tax=Frankliniella fusca TaxID=407009 RepID=A0AAE1L6Y6_9NEOP|nr:Nitric oxide synthase, inducible [Frankliniella fusca]
MKRFSLGGLAKSQFPVFTLFAQRTCLRGAHAVSGQSAKAGGASGPGRHWAFETVRGHVLRTSVRRHHRVASRRDCMQLCLDQRDFVCRNKFCSAIEKVA